MRKGVKHDLEINQHLNYQGCKYTLLGRTT
jgi:hypothetical protein